MKTVQELFDNAYSLSIVEEKHDEAIALCRKALKIEPRNYRVKVFLGMLLGDHAQNGLEEARCLFKEAFLQSRSSSEVCSGWPEEAVLYHLGICEQKTGKVGNAQLLFLLQYLASGSNLSRSQRFNSLEEEDSSFAKEFEEILDKTVNFCFGELE